MGIITEKELEELQTAHMLKRRAAENAFEESMLAGVEARKSPSAETLSYHREAMENSLRAMRDSELASAQYLEAEAVERYTTLDPSSIARVEWEREHARLQRVELIAALRDLFDPIEDKLESVADGLSEVANNTAMMSL